jgi:hypothetical protein
MRKEAEAMPNFKPVVCGSIECWQYGSDDGYPILHMHGATPMPFSDGLARVIESGNLRVMEVLRPGYGSSSMWRYKNICECTKAMADSIV